MPSEKDDGHIGIEALWKYRAEKIALSPEQLHHLYVCDDCLALLGICQISTNIDEAERLRVGQPRAGKISR